MPLPRGGFEWRSCGGPRGVSEPPCSFVDVTHQRGTGPHNLSRRHGEVGASPLGPVATNRVEDFWIEGLDAIEGVGGC